MRKGLRGTAACLAALTVLAAAAIAAVANGPSSTAAAATTGCHLGNGVKHVIEITFDNVHFNRDNPNVLSDLEQMPALRTSSPERHAALEQPYAAHRPHGRRQYHQLLRPLRRPAGPGAHEHLRDVWLHDGTVTPKSSFAYWTGTYGLDSFPNQPYSANVPAAGAPPSTPPAPWVPFTRAGCDVGDVSTANMVLENLEPRPAERLRRRTRRRWPQYNADTDTRSRTRRPTTTKASACTAPQGSAFCSTAQAVKFGQTVPSSTAVTDVLPDEPGGYVGFQALFGHKYLQPQLVGAANSGGNRVVNGAHLPGDRRRRQPRRPERQRDGRRVPRARPGLPRASARSAPRSRWRTSPTCRRRVCR